MGLCLQIARKDGDEMTDHKFTDDDVIKALECLSGAEIFCRECAFGRLEDHGFACKKNVANAALALINRQKAEIERLKEENRLLSENADTAFQDGLNEAQDLYAEQIKGEIKAETIKEFAERLKDDMVPNIDDTIIESFVEDYIDTLVKEMTEETK